MEIQMEIYVIMEKVDLGGEPQVAFYDKTVAENNIKSMNNDHRSQKLDDLLKIGYSLEHAKDIYTNMFYLETIELT